MNPKIQVWGQMTPGEDILFPQQPSARKLAQLFSFDLHDHADEYIDFFRVTCRINAPEFMVFAKVEEVLSFRLRPETRPVSGESFILEFYDIFDNWQPMATDVRYEMPTRTDLIDWLSGNGSLRFKIVTP